MSIPYIHGKIQLCRCKGNTYLKGHFQKTSCIFVNDIFFGESIMKKGLFVISAVCASLMAGRTSCIADPVTDAKEAAVSALCERLEEAKETDAYENAPALLRSYDTDNIYIENAAFSYDNALTALAFISEDRQSDAQEIADAFVYAAEHDRAGTVRIRNAYAAGPVFSDSGEESAARLPGWYDAGREEWCEDRYQVGSNVGNTSYVALALMQYYRAYGGELYLTTACSLMDWVIDHCSDDSAGFTGGFDGWEESDPPVVYPFTYKSLEHNIDAYAAFSALYTVTGIEKYGAAAKSALQFIESMYDPDRGYFMTGTLDDGVTPNTSVVVLDVQVWGAMALGGLFAPYTDALRIVEEMKTEEGGYPFCLENKNGGWWAEGTAYTALMYRGLGNEPEYQGAMDALRGIQLESGLFPAATVDNLSTGMDLFDGSPWEYGSEPHIAPTAWFIMAANGFNPYKYDDET